MNETLEAMARAIFKSWFVDFDPIPDLGHHKEWQDSLLGRIPKGWKVGTVGEVVKVIGGGTPSTKEPSYWDGGIHCWATPKDLSKLTSPIILDTERKVTDAGLSKISSGLLQAGTLLLSSRAPVGYLAISQVPIGINQGFISMICEDQVSNYYMLNWAEIHMEEIKGRSCGTTFQEISKRNFRPMLILVPSQKVMAEFNNYVEPLYHRIKFNLEQSHTLASIRDALLPKLLSGEIRVKDTERFLDKAL